MTSDQNTVIKIITSDDLVFQINFFSPEIGLIKTIKPFLYSLIDDDIEKDDWQDIIDKYNDDDLDKEKIKESINLPGINSRVFRYLLDFTRKVSDFKNNNLQKDLGRFSYNLLRNRFEILDTNCLMDFINNKKSNIKTEKSCRNIQFTNQELINYMHLKNIEIGVKRT